MEEKLIPDYSKYDIDLLVDVYSRLDRDDNPLKSKALDDELKKRFKLDPETEINPKVVMGFIDALQLKKNKVKSESDYYLKMIKQGWYIGLILTSLTLLSWAMKMRNNYLGINGNNASPYDIVEILLLFGLSYGILKKSRFCAVIFSIYFLIPKLYQIINSPIPYNIIAMVSLLVFGPFLIRAIIGAIKFHKLNLVTNSVEDENVIICPACGEKNHIANYNCHCGNILKPV